MPRATSRLAVRNQPRPPTARAGGQRAELAAHRCRLRMPPRIGTPTNRKIAIVWKSKPPPRASRAAPPWRAAARLRQAFAGDPLAEPVDRGVQPAGEVAGAKRRHDLLLDDAAARRCRAPRPASALATWICDRAVVLRDDDDQAVADVLAADLPLLADALGERRRRLPARSSARSGSRAARRARSRSPPACSTARRPAPGSACRSGRSRGRSAAAPAARPGPRRDRPRARAGRQRRRSASPDPVTRAKAADQRGAEAGLSKLTDGGTEICASFWTVKLGLTL